MNIRLEILSANYWEHYKVAKELAGFLNIDHPKRLRIESELNNILTEMHKLNK